MGRTGRFMTLLLAGLGVFAVVYLLFGDSLGGGLASSGYSEQGLLDIEGGPLTSAGLEAAGKKPKTPEEIAAEEAARAAAAKAFPREEGIFGTVTDGQGRALQGASIHVIPDPPEDRKRQGTPDRPPLASTMSKEDGAYLVGPVPADSRVKLRAEATGYAPTIQRVARRGARYDLILDEGGALEVRVLDSLSKAVPGATVVHQAASVVTLAQTDEEGHASFAALPTGTGNLVVTKVGLGAVRDNNVAVAPGKTEERTLVMPPALELSGSILRADDKRPLSGVEVSLRYPMLPTLEPEGEPGPVVHTGDDGRFRISASVGGQEQVIVRAVKEGFAEGRAWRNAATKGEASIELHEIGEAFTGRVTDADHQPVAGILVTYMSVGNEKPDDIPETKTDEDGGFTLPLPPWAGAGWSLNVAAISQTLGVGAVQARVPKKDAPPANPLQIELGGTGSVKGVVTDGGAQPVQGAVVSLGPDWNALRSRPGRSPMSWQVLNLLNGGRHFNLSGVTGADGTYLIAGVPALEYRVTAVFGLDQATLRDSVTVRGEEVAEADVSLGEAGTIEGWIMDSEEKPVAGAYVYARPVQRQRYGWWRGNPNARSQSDGRFVLRGVSDERYNLWASASGYGSAQEKNVSMGMKELTLRLKARGWIEGVLYHEGDPFGGTFTIVSRPVKNNRTPSPYGNRSWMPGQQQRTFNTDNGHFKIRGLNAGDYTVQASTPEGLIAVQKDVVTVVDGRASREARLDLQAGAVIKGVVRDDETGEVIRNAWVYASARGGLANNSGATSGNGRSDAKGKYEIRGLGSGAYTVTVWASNGSQISGSVEVQAGEERTLNLVRERPGTVQITIVDEKGEPLVDARPNLQSATGMYINVNVAALKKDGIIGDTYDWRTLWNTDETGTITRYHVPPGEVTVWAWKSGYTMDGARPTVVVRSGRVSQVEVKMKKQPTR